MGTFQRIKYTMKLTEILDTDQDSNFQQALDAFIKRHGLEHSYGTNANVLLDTKRNYVYRFWFRDPGYEKWLKYAQLHQDNPHIVKILGKVRTSDARYKGLPKNLTMKYVKIEKLTPMVDEKLIHAIDSAANLSDEYFKMYLKDWEDGKELPEWVKPLMQVAHKYPKLLSTILELKQHGLANDLTGDNVMMRGQVPVITDPLGS